MPQIDLWELSFMSNHQWNARGVPHSASNLSAEEVRKRMKQSEKERTARRKLAAKFAEGDTVEIFGEQYTVTRADEFNIWVKVGGREQKRSPSVATLVRKG